MPVLPALNLLPHCSCSYCTLPALSMKLHTLWPSYVLYVRVPIDTIAANMTAAAALRLLRTLTPDLLIMRHNCACI